MPARNLLAVRGATTLAEDDAHLYRQELAALVRELLERNHIREQDLLNIFFTVTPDLRSDNPARIVREHFSFDRVPMMCALEPEVIDMQPRCVRILLQFFGDMPAERVCPVYLNDARHLRPDLG